MIRRVFVFVLGGGGGGGGSGGSDGSGNDSDGGGKANDGGGGGGGNDNDNGDGDGSGKDGGDPNGTVLDFEVTAAPRVADVAEEPTTSDLAEMAADLEGPNVVATPAELADMAAAASLGLQVPLALEANTGGNDHSPPSAGLQDPAAVESGITLVSQKLLALSPGQGDAKVEHYARHLVEQVAAGAADSYTTGALSTNGVVLAAIQKILARSKHTISKVLPAMHEAVGGTPRDELGADTLLAINDKRPESVAPPKATAFALVAGAGPLVKLGRQMKAGTRVHGNSRCTDQLTGTGFTGEALTAFARELVAFAAVSKLCPLWEAAVRGALPPGVASTRLNIFAVMAAPPALISRLVQKLVGCDSFCPRRVGAILRLVHKFPSFIFALGSHLRNESGHEWVQARAVADELVPLCTAAEEYMGGPLGRMNGRGCDALARIARASVRSRVVTGEVLCLASHSIESARRECAFDATLVLISKTVLQTYVQVKKAIDDPESFLKPVTRLSPAMVRQMHDGCTAGLETIFERFDPLISDPRFASNLPADKVADIAKALREHRAEHPPALDMAKLGGGTAPITDLMNLLAEGATYTTTLLGIVLGLRIEDVTKVVSVVGFEDTIEANLVAATAGKVVVLAGAASTPSAKSLAQATTARLDFRSASRKGKTHVDSNERHTGGAEADFARSIFSAATGQPHLTAGQGDRAMNSDTGTGTTSLPLPGIVGDLILKYFRLLNFFRRLCAVTAHCATLGGVGPSPGPGGSALVFDWANGGSKQPSMSARDAVNAGFYAYLSNMPYLANGIDLNSLGEGKKLRVHLVPIIDALRHFMEQVRKNYLAAPTHFWAVVTAGIAGHTVATADAFYAGAPVVAQALASKHDAQALLQLQLLRVLGLTYAGDIVKAVEDEMQISFPLKAGAIELANAGVCTTAEPSLPPAVESGTRETILVKDLFQQTGFGMLPPDGQLYDYVTNPCPAIVTAVEHVIAAYNVACSARCSLQLERPEANSGECA